jgi:uncharacterized membrane protein YcjF (UPF0283 family)
VSPFAIVLLVAALILLVAAEWTRFSKLGEARTRRDRARRRSRLRVVDEGPDDDFARSVERDLASLPTIDERDAGKRRK